MQMIAGMCLFITLAIIIQIALVLKCALFVLRQISPHVLPHFQCNKSNESIGQQYQFILVVYSSLFIGRWLEALIIHIHIYKFFFSQSTITPDTFKWLCKKRLMENYAKEEGKMRYHNTTCHFGDL